MAQPKKQTSHRKTGLRRSSMVLDLARKVNGILASKGEKIRVYTTKRESGVSAGVVKKERPQKQAKKTDKKQLKT